MFNIGNIGQIALSAIGALILTTVAVGSAVGPARAIETSPVVGHAQLSVQTNA